MSQEVVSLTPERMHELDEQRRGLEARAKECECAICGGELVVTWDGAAKEHRLKCGPDKSHEGFRQVVTLAMAYRSGTGVEVTMKDAIERRRPLVQSVEAMAGICQAKFPQLAEGSLAMQFALAALELGLDPRFGEVAPLTFRQKTGPGQVRLVVEFMITTRGRQTLAAREAPDLFLTAPALVDVTDPQRKQELGADPGDFVAVATGRLRVDPELGPDGKPFFRAAVGIYKKSEHEALKRSSASDYLPPGKWPQNQAQKRAERHWYENYLPQSVTRARDAFLRVRDRLGVDKVLLALSEEFAAAPTQLPVAQAPRPVAQATPAAPAAAPPRPGGAPKPWPASFHNWGDAFNYVWTEHKITKGEILKAAGQMDETQFADYGEVRKVVERILASRQSP